MNHIILENNSSVPLQQIPLLEYTGFFQEVSRLLRNPDCHCVNYYAFPETPDLLRFIAVIADDAAHNLCVTSFSKPLTDKTPLESLAARHYAVHIFEREIHEQYGVMFSGHPWQKPVRYPFNRNDKSAAIGNYPFYHISSYELHEVGVGPIHAGIIEPGHFRFICNGEKVLHLEIQLGYQHRGIEQLMSKNKSLLHQTLLAESIVGDTVIGHSTAFAQIVETLNNIHVSENLQISRTIACELERIAMHTADLSALCTDVAFQLGSAVLQGLRTIIINTFLIWCGNRFGRKLIRCGYEPFVFDTALVSKIKHNLDLFEKRYTEISDKTFDMPSVLARFERTGIITHEQNQLIGAVGMAARSAGLNRDIRVSHPFAFYGNMEHNPVVLEGGDVKARAKLRDLEIRQSLKHIRKLLSEYSMDGKPQNNKPEKLKSAPDMFAVSLTEGWRGEICHCAVTNNEGYLKNYKIKDPSLHNWMALALAVRNNDISDFPVCNKSFNLSYCGNDL
ncbi:MAG: NADH-quinone oxidoreductase subunit C [Bacteroidales bacterium]|jgi:Ni,Fe-hydrogenase III large subunit|nr:NADH dehydrogenase subunit [Bacteroidales bacterium]